MGKIFLTNNLMITTIIPTYKRPYLLKRALTSILNQTYPNFQVHICDNASNDETEKIAREFTSDSRIFYHRHENNIGMIQNYKFGFQLIKTPYFSFLSDDDYFLPIFYETAINNLKHNLDAACVACNVNVVDENETTLFSTLSNWPESGYLKNPEGLLALCTPPYKPIIPTCTLFNNDVLKYISPKWEKSLESLWDHEYFLRIASKHPIVLEKKICGVFFAHSNSYSTKSHSLCLTSCNEIAKYLRSFNSMINHLKPIFPKKIKNEVIRKLNTHCLSFFLSYFVHYKKTQKPQNLIRLAFIFLKISSLRNFLPLLIARALKRLKK